jgi:hypothetical protein
MCKLNECSPKSLPDRVDRCTARFARIARSNAYNGGASALTLLDRLERMGSPNTSEYHDAITSAYHSSTGTAREHLAYECPECGSPCLGETAAREHCTMSDDEWEQVADEGDIDE